MLLLGLNFILLLKQNIPKKLIGIGLLMLHSAFKVIEDHYGTICFQALALHSFFVCVFASQQPHHILQKRLLEAKLSRGRTNMFGVTPNNGGVRLSCNLLNSHEDEEEEEEDFIFVPCKVSGSCLRYFRTNTFL